MDPGPIAAASPAPVLRTARLTLRPIGMPDLAGIAALHADPRVTARLVDGIPDTPAKALIFLRWNAPLAARGIGTFAVRRHGRPALIGLFSLTPFQDDDGVLEFGGKLVPVAWQGGLGVEAGAALLDHGFGALGRERIVSAFDPANRSVPAALRRLGFVPDRPTRLFGRDVAVMQLSRDVWLAQGGRPLPRGRTGPEAAS